MSRAVLLFAVLITRSAFAIDGQVLINQSTVMAMGGFPYVISSAGSYKLSGPLNVTTTKHAIVINHDDVTLDLNGFAITGPGTYLSAGSAGCTPAGTPTHCAGVYSTSGYQNLTIRNGVIRAFADGVYLGASGLIADVQTSKNLVGITADGVLGGSFVIVRCTASANDFWGMTAQFATVSDSAASGNTGDGIVAAFSTLIHNVFTGNGRYGMLAQGSIVFGSNVFLNNKTSDFNLDLGGVGGASFSQKNNLCTSGPC
jgi:hypothetical protein